MTDSPISTTARAVTFFEDRAEVERIATLTATAGSTRVLLAGISPVVDDRSVQVRSEQASVRVLQSRVVRRTVPATDSSAELATELQDARDRKQVCAQALERATAAEARVQTQLEQWVSALREGPAQLSQRTTAEAWNESYRVLSEQLARCVAATHEARNASAEAEQEEARVAQRIAAKNTRLSAWEALFEVHLETAEHVAPGSTVTLHVTYRVPCALWRPSHLAKLETTESPKSNVQLVTYATVWQNTGEIWNGVEARFSTARPGKASSAPLLSTDLLSSRAKSAEERKTISVAAREETIQQARSSSVSEIPGVDDGGEVLTYLAKELLTLPSDGRPMSIEIAQRVIAVEVSRLVASERAPVAHVRASGILGEGGPLLAGPVRLARGASFVGKAHTLFVGPGETFTMGFASDEAVRVRRTVQDEHDTVPLVGTKLHRRTVLVHLSNLSGSARNIEVVERIPVSEISDVQVVPQRIDGWTHDEKDGFLRTHILLEAHAHRTLSFTFEVRSSAKVQLQW